MSLCVPAELGLPCASSCTGARPLCCLSLAAGLHKQIPECCRDGAMAAVNALPLFKLLSPILAALTEDHI